ncbi:MAG: tail fiber domain-containing protein [Pseudomonadota bacterium]
MPRIKIEHLSEDSTELSDDMLDDAIGGSAIPSNSLYSFPMFPQPNFGSETIGNSVSVGSGFGSRYSSFGWTSLASASAFSDRRLKTNIRAIGHSKAGVALYEYRYIWDDAPRIGVMADEVPSQTVTQTASGYSRVDYAQLGL